jgi:hypothetical protein
MRVHREVSVSGLRAPSGTQGIKLKVIDKFNIWYVMVHKTYRRTEKTIVNDEFKRVEMEKTVILGKRPT